MFKPGIIRNSLAASTNTTSADNLLSLYNKIPDYAEVKHLGHSDFVRALEKLKEEFRRVRSSLYISNEDGHLEDIDVDDVSYLESRLKILNIRDSASLSPIRRPGTALKSATGYEQGSEKSNLEVHGRQSQLHRSPTTSNYAINYLNYNKPSRSLSFVNFDRKERQNFSSDEEENNKRVDEYTSINSESCSEGSSPDLGSYAYREFKEYERKDYVPKNIEKRLLERKAFNNSAPSLSGGGKGPTREDEGSHLFKAHPVPSHVYKPLYDFIMLKNQRRSQKVREQSKQKLMAQVKPFNFANKPSSSKSFPHASSDNKPLTNYERAAMTQSHKEVLNNAKPLKSSRRCSSHTNNFRMVNHFKANPAPPRTRALLSAMRLKEQQEYRELKKRLRAEALLKNAALPPSMAARDKRTKISNTKLDTIIQEYQNSCNSTRDKNNKNRDKEQSTDLDGDNDNNTFTDEDRLSEDSFRYVDGTPNNISPVTSAISRKRGNFTPFGKSRHSSAASGIFECTSNDNVASRLRIQETRRKEANRIKREEEELLKLMRNETRRKKLKDSHLSAWRRAHSYSSHQDITMRRQLREAASILERQSFVKDMSSMLSRVRSAPLLLEGTRERRYEPCKKHKEEFLQYGDRSLSNNNKQLATHRFSPRKAGSRNGNWFLDRYGFGDDDGPSRSETVALAEGSLTNASEEEDDDNDMGGADENDDTANYAENDENKIVPTPMPRNTKKKHVRVNLVDNDGEGLHSESVDKE
ncbi:hypothetical protein Fcan01_05182 [Folsomia candida]|uniref:Uncharacterized protein n=2 Tax=Folsomia candida TaxID=158441 RepID=A0A226EQP5_FOLCA|nr:hypothetical protein Fcan01_05182 [Folsomia candida]